MSVSINLVGIDSHGSQFCSDHYFPLLPIPHLSISFPAVAARKRSRLIDLGPPDADDLTEVPEAGLLTAARQWGPWSACQVFAWDCLVRDGLMNCQLFAGSTKSPLPSL